MVRKLLGALACMLVAAAAFAQTTRTTTTTERVTVTGTLIGVEEGTAANYQPARTLVVRTEKANPERFDLYGNGIVYDKLGRVVTGKIKPGTRVRIFYTTMDTNTGPRRVVDHVELQE